MIDIIFVFAFIAVISWMLYINVKEHKRLDGKFLQRKSKQILLPQLSLSIDAPDTVSFPMSILEWNADRQVDNGSFFISMLDITGNYIYGSVDIEQFCKDHQILFNAAEPNIHQVMDKLYIALVKNNLIVENTHLHENY